MEVFKTENLVDNYDGETNVLHKCGEIYYSTENSTISIFCTLCGSNFEYGNETYFKHIIAQHLGDFSSNSNHNPTDLDVKNTFENKIGNSTNTEQVPLNEIKHDNQTLNTMKLKEEELSEDNDNKSIASDTYKDPPEINEKRRKNKKMDKHIKCPECLKQFRADGHLRLHMKTHLNSTKKLPKEGFICELCGRIFKFKKNLECHYDIAHNPNRKLYPCTESDCQKRFTTTENLKAHVRHYHTKELPFVCNVENCNKRYASNKGLKAHQEMHLNKIFSCPECNEQYYHKKSMQTHYKRHHKFAEMFHCEQCDKSFNNPYSLKIHMVCHTNERPFRCNQCSASFPRRKALVAHKKIHSKTKDEVCQLCQQAFNIYEGLYQHMKVKHGIKYHRGMTLEQMQEKKKPSKQSLYSMESKTIDTEEIHIVL